MTTNKNKLLCIFLTAILTLSILSFFSAQPANAGAVPYFYPKATVIDMFKQLCDSNSWIAHYESAGSTYNGNTVWLFMMGNPNGGRILWDGSLHGWEDIGTAVEYEMAKWLLTSGDPEAQRILQNNYVMFVPVVNYDAITRQNADYYWNPYGTDLNRNFPVGWKASNPNDNSNYAGHWAGSEAETQAMIHIFRDYHPNYYVNTHYGGDPIFESDYVDWNQANNLFNRINQLNGQFGYDFPYPTKVGNWDNGYAVATAASYGAKAFLFEMGSATQPYWTSGDPYWHTAHSLSDVKNYFFPRVLPVLIAMAEESGKWVTPTNYYFNANYAPYSSPSPTPRATPQTSTGLYFTDGFSSGFDAWSGTSMAPNNQVIYTNPNFISPKGTPCAVFTTLGGGYSGYESAFAYKYIPQQSSLYTGGNFFVMTSGAYSENSRFYFIRYLSGGLSGNSLAFAGWRMVNGQLHWDLTLRDGYGWATVLSQAVPDARHWYNVQLHWTNYGQAELYVDGNCVASISGINTSTLGNADTILFGTAEAYNCGHTAIYAGDFKAADYSF